jgi:peptide/nickel transport system substrate-binding protein
MKLKAGFSLGALLVIFTMLLAACGGTSTTPATNQHHALTIGNFVGDAFTKATSPYNGNAQSGVLGMVYETLFFTNLNDNSTKSLLGQSESWNSDNTVLTVNLRQGVKWSDGQAFSSADVAYTFNTVLKEAKGVADVNGDWNYLASVAAPDANTVTFTFKKADVPAAYYILSATYIVPQHIWSTAVTNPTTDNPDLIGTGPFKLESFAPAEIKYTRNTNYWNNAQNKIDELDYPAVKDNTTLEEELIAGQLDWGGFAASATFQSAYVNKDPNHNKYWFSSTADVALYLNDSQAPFNDANVRQAISYALDRTAMSQQAENGYEAPANLAGLTANNSAYLESKYSGVGTSPDLSKVDQLLTSDGYTKTNGLYEKNGQKITVKYNVPSDWSDWVAVANIMKQNLQAAGIDGEINAIADNDYFTARSTGSFQAMIGGFFSGPTPFYQFNSHLNSANDAAKSGGWNWGHYSNSTFDGLIQQYAQTSDSTQQKSLINQMQDLFFTQQPVVPLLDAANWYEYSTKHYTGWPSQSSRYALGPTYDAPGNEIIVTSLQPVN